MGLGLDPRADPVRGRARRAVDVRLGRDAPPLPDGRLRLLPLTLVPRREPRRLRRLLRDARDVLLPRPVHAGHPRLLAVAGWAALPALDDHRDDHRTDRWAHGRPRRLAPADDGRTSADRF